MGRKEFFEININFSQLEEHAFGKDTGLRWATAIELGQLGTDDAVSLLWSLTTDSDEHVREAANLSLQNCDQKIVSRVLATKWKADPATVEDAESTVQAYVAWKIRPLDEPSPRNEWAVDAAILNIVQIEGPITGSRLLRLYGTAVYPASPKKLRKSRIISALKRLERRQLIKIIAESSAEVVEYFTVLGFGKPEIVVRHQGPRKLHEIPVTEVIARVKMSMGDDFEYASQNDKFKVLQQVYGLKQADLHKVGEVLAQEWASFLS